MRVVLGRMKEGDGNCCSLVAGSIEAAEATETAEDFFLVKNLSIMSMPLAMMITDEVNGEEQVAQGV